MVEPFRCNGNTYDSKGYLALKHHQESEMLNKVFLTIAKRSLYHDARILSIIRNSSPLDRRVLNSNLNSYVRPDSNLCLIKRFKRTKKSQEVSDDEDEIERDVGPVEDLDSVLPGSKLFTLKIGSLRFSKILALALRTSQTKIVKAFYESRVRINGGKVLKKSILVNEGNEIDLINGPYVNNPTFLSVHRVTVLSVQTTEEGKYRCRVSVDKNLIIENYEDPWKEGCT